MRKVFFTIIALLIMLVSFAQVSLATGLIGYQPKLPKKLER